MKLLILTTRSGGPLTWTKSFYTHCKEHHPEIDVTYKNDLKSLFLSPFYIGKYDIVHSMLPLPFKLWKQPILLNIRGDYKKEISLKNPYAMLYPLTRLFAKKIITPSKFMVKKLNFKKPAIIPNAIESSVVSKKKSYAVKDTLKLVIVTSFSIEQKAKSILSLIKILEKLPKNINYKLDVYGDGDFITKIKQKVNNSNINFKGRSSSLKKDLSTYDIFTYYSNLDNFPNAVLEAMAAGLPVISNNIGAISEMIDNNKNGYYAKNNNDYLKKLVELINSQKTREQLGKGAVRKVETQFSWKKIANSYIETYRGVLDAR